jgi:hypothetical protein
MPFQPLITDVISADEVEVLKFGGNLEVTVPFAESEDGDTIVSIVCLGKRVSYEDRVFWDFSFKIAVTPDPQDPEEVLEIWTPAAAAPFIPATARPHILATVAECYKALVRDAGKLPIYRVCYPTDGQIPRRNELLTTTLEDAGYEVEESGTDESGRAFWMMVPTKKEGG